jgi:DNA-binding transcriptional LysR family regulator
MEDRTMMASAIATKKTIAIGFVASTMYARLPGLIRAFRKAAPDVELSLVEMGSIDQIAALKEGLIDVGFGRIRFDDPAVPNRLARRAIGRSRCNRSPLC